MTPQDQEAVEPSDAEVLAACRVMMPALFKYGLEPQERDGEATRATLRRTADTARKMLKAAQVAAPKDEGWRPIESAPKGKTVLAGYRNALGNWRTVRATYYLAGTLEASEDLDDSIVDENGCAPEGWYEECETRDDILPCDHDPTHWRPLPTALTQSAGGTD